MVKTLQWQQNLQSRYKERNHTNRETRRQQVIREVMKCRIMLRGTNIRKKVGQWQRERKINDTENKCSNPRTNTRKNKIFKLIQRSTWRVDVQFTTSHILVAPDDGPMKARNRYRFIYFIHFICFNIYNIWL
jgi:hypothetical protein